MGITITILLVLTIVGWIGSVLWERIRKNAARTPSQKANKMTNRRIQIEDFLKKQRKEYEEAYRQYRNQQPAHPDHTEYDEDDDTTPFPTTLGQERIQPEYNSTNNDNKTGSNLLNVNKQITNRKQNKTTAPANNIAEELNLSDVDNARKAFIASELFDRKY